MELEEARKELEEFIGLFYEFPNPKSVSIRDYEVQAIEIVLKALENSIPKKKIEEILKKYGHKELDYAIEFYKDIKELLQDK